jgi:hypothetical protein
MPMTNLCAPVEQFQVVQNRLCIPFAIVHNATPALKTYSSDLGAAMVLSLEGLTAAAAAIDTGTNFATPTDTTGVFGILLYNLGTVSNLDNATAAYNPSSGTIALTPAGASTTGVTALGNIAISADWTGNLATTDLRANLHVDYRISRSKIPAVG